MILLLESKEGFHLLFSQFKVKHLNKGPKQLGYFSLQKDKCKFIRRKNTKNRSRKALFIYTDCFLYKVAKENRKKKLPPIYFGVPSQFWFSDSSLVCIHYKISWHTMYLQKSQYYQPVEDGQSLSVSEVEMTAWECIGKEFRIGQGCCV